MLKVLAHPPNTAEKAVLGENEITAITMQYSGMSTTELKAECKARGITGYSGLNKEELIEILSRA